MLGIHPILAFGIPSGPDLIILLVIVLVLFGAKRLPELARGLGQSVNEFKKAKDEFDKEVSKPSISPATPASPATPTIAASTPVVSAESHPATPAPTKDEQKPA
ncbi:MAG: twin-arginine translocase TatA/TatE family subunit [Verrucomicrobia bacterium]|nr:twin-arginine translocase TatA/TatE family subunit [Verrucomicrobiota bacterium]